MDKPRFLVSDGEPPAEPPAEPAPGPTPEQRAAIEAVLAGRIDEVAPRHCVSCDSTDCAAVYALLEHSSFRTDVRYKFMRSETIEQSTLAPQVFPMCARCYRDVEKRNRGARVASWIAGTSLMIAMGYFVAALMSAPTAIALGLLFGGGALLAAAMTYAVINTRSLHAHLRLTALPGLSVLVISKDRDKVIRHLEIRKLISLEIENELDRMAIDAVPPPKARLLSK